VRSTMRIAEEHPFVPAECELGESDGKKGGRTSRSPCLGLQAVIEKVAADAIVLEEVPGRLGLIPGSSRGDHAVDSPAKGEGPYKRRSKARSGRRVLCHGRLRLLSAGE